MNLGIARVVIVVALAAAGISVLVGGFPGSVAGSPDASGSVSPTGSPTSTGTRTPDAPPPTPAPNTSGVSFAVLNGTTVAGLAGDFESFLESKNYLVGKDADDSPIKPIGETTVYFRGGDDAKQNRADAAHVARKYINGPGVKAKIQALGPEFASTLTGPGDNEVVLLIVLGTDYADAQSN